MLTVLKRCIRENNDFAGWIIIGGTVINYPVMGNGAVKDYYLHRNFLRIIHTAGYHFWTKSVI